jgi:hypothetical protein
MVADDDVWDVVQRTRRQERKLKRQQAAISLFGSCFCGRRRNANEDNHSDGDIEEGRTRHECDPHDVIIGHDDPPVEETPEPRLPMPTAHAGEANVGLQIRSMAKSSSDEESSDV